MLRVWLSAVGAVCVPLLSCAATAPINLEATSWKDKVLSSPTIDGGCCCFVVSSRRFLLPNNSNGHAVFGRKKRRLAAVGERRLAVVGERSRPNVNSPSLVLLSARSASKEADLLLLDDDDNDKSGNDKDNNTNTTLPNALLASVTLDMPFSAATAFTAFADLKRHPEWSPWIRSVTYVDPQPNVEPPSKYCRWTLGLVGGALRFSWTSETTRYDSPREIAWKSQWGLKNAGKVVLVETTPNQTCDMTLAVEFILPRPVLLFLSLRRQGRDSVMTKVVRVVERNILREILLTFRTVVAQEVAAAGQGKEEEALSGQEDSMKAEMEEPQTVKGRPRERRGLRRLFGRKNRTG